MRATRPKVLWVLKELGRGGAERLLLELLPHLGAYEMIPAIIGPEPLDLLPEYEEAGLAVHLIRVKSKLSLSWIGEFRAVIEKVQPDIVHLHSPQPAAFVRILLARRQTPVVYTEHSLWESRHPVTRFANASTFFLNDAVIAVSEEVHQCISRSLLARSVRTRASTVPNGIDVEGVRRDAARSTHRLPQGSFGAITHLTTKKGADLVVEAARILKESGNEKPCILVGSGPLEAQLKQRVKRYALENVHFMGTRSDARALMAQLEVLVVAGRHEGLPLVLLEGMALGLPIVATRVGGIPEVLEHKRSGLLVEPGDPDAIAEAIRTIYADQELRASLGTHALASVRADFSAERTAEKLTSVYRLASRS